MARRLTSSKKLQSTQCESEDNGVRDPFALDNEGAEDEQSSWDVDPVDVLLRAQRFFGRHGGWYRVYTPLLLRMKSKRGRKTCRGALGTEFRF